MVKEEQLPGTAGIRQALSRIDFSDTFATTNHSDALKVLIDKIFGKPPVWVSALFYLRNVLVRLVGIKPAKETDNNQMFEPGGYIGFFKIYQIYDDEVIVGANDDHLDFRASIYNSGEQQFNIKVSTLVRFHNRKGRWYMAVIKPFHRMIIRQMVSRVYQR